MEELAVHPEADIKELAEELSDRQRKLEEMWHENRSYSMVFVEQNHINPTSVYHASRTPFKALALQFVPQYYWAIRNCIREIGIRRVNKQRDKVIVCGIGDSLNRNLFYLREAVRRGWKIMAVDRARPQLIGVHGLVPDYTLSLDGQPHVAPFFGSTDERFLPQKGEIIFLDYQVHPSVFEIVHKSPATLAVFATGHYGGFNSVLAQEMKYGHISGMDTTIVTPAALHEVIKMNFKKIVTIGTELGWKNREDVEGCYAPYAYKLPDGSWTIEVFEKAAKYFWDIAKVLDASNRYYSSMKKFYIPKVLLDASGGIDKGYPFMPLSEIIEKY